MTNITVPNKPVTALNGISESVNDLDKMSVRIINEPPNVIQSGMVLFVLCPTINLTICGITRSAKTYRNGREQSGYSNNYITVVCIINSFSLSALSSKSH